MKETNTKDLDTGQYDKKSYGLGVGFGVPMNEFDTVRVGFDVDMSDIKLVDHHLKGIRTIVKMSQEETAVVVIKMKLYYLLDTLLIKEIVPYIQERL